MNDQTDVNPSRPNLLSAICILSFIGSGTSFLSYAVLFMTYDVWREAYGQGMFDFIVRDEVQKQTLSIMMDLPAYYYLLQAVLFSVSLFGVFKMWKLSKIGFHFYTVAQIVLLITIQLFIPGSPFPFLPALLTASFVFLYFRFLVIMR